MKPDIEDDLRQLRCLEKALRLIADGLEDRYAGEAIYGVLDPIRDRIEAIEEKLYKKPKLISEAT
jgi:hypothetical protein